jgi:guanosine-3',5'-bis(diphosphate) 3'-pyrophosphohydrolase
LDRRLAPLSTQLTSGQQVEIVTAPGARPNPAWLNFVVTGKARSNIKHFLKKQQRDESIELGKRLVEKALRGFGLNLAQLQQSYLDTVVEVSNLDSMNNLFEEVGLGNRTALLVAKQIAKITTISGTDDALADISLPHPLAIKGTEGIVVTYAKCCRPIPGDSIGGYIEKGHGLFVHIEQCPNLSNYRHNPDNYVSLRWEDHIKGDFPVDLRVEILNQRGSLASLAIGISDAESNIEHINAEEFDGRYFSVSLTVTVKNRVHLARVLRKIRNAKNVIRVVRVKPRLKKKKKISSLP